ncbi:hypothetical protein [Lewinella sp. W8]|uniref:hypothetical protein n=1 Tax=Lewinella sp. W8 TaxID=2528208 RepID=UPI00106852A4|nr:hypothetical protein [Lewinella sp. W8]MTB51954.1 hypothetical protein [Lewinella sp. W8]
MQDSKVVRQIAAMDGRERERLRQFVDSPYFNRHKATQQLLAFILKELGKTRPRITEERAEAVRARANTGQSLSDLQSGLMKLVNRFLAVEQLQEEPFREEVLTLKRTKELHRYRLLENRGKRLDKRVDRHPYRDGDLHLAAYEWKSINGYYQGNVNRSDTREMQAMLNHLDRYFIIEKLRHGCQLTYNMLLMNTQYDFFLLKEIMEYLRGEEGAAMRASEPSIDCYFHIMLSLWEPEEEQHYERIRHYLQEGMSKLPLKQQKDIFSFASNYCIRRIMSGHAAYRMELLELYRRRLDTGIIYDESGEISEWEYKNIVTLGSATGEFEWTENFIEDNRERLPEKKRANAYALNKAQFLYTTKRLDEAAKLLITVTDSDVKYHLARVLLEVRIAYDQEDQEYALNLLETFRLYVRRNRNISTKDKRSYSNYIRFTKQLVNLKHQFDYIDRETYDKKMTNLHQTVQDTELLVARQWLIKESTPMAMA